MPKSFPTYRTLPLLASAVLAAFVSVTAVADKQPSAQTPDDVALAEQFLDAFYRWDAQALTKLMRPSEQAANALYYQAWAEAAHYQIVTRRPCAHEGSVIECRVTVTDDFGQAMGYQATDTFRLHVAHGLIDGVTFAGDDPPIFEEVFAWLSQERPHLFAGPPDAGACHLMFAGGTTPAACARAIAIGARDFMRLRNQANP